MQKCQQFIKSLMKPRCHMELRAIRVGGGVTGRMFADSAAEVEKFALRYGRDAEIYMGVAPRISSNGTGGLSNCAFPTALWIDADDEATTRAELALFDLDPSAIIHSGRGLHVYWFLRDESGDVGEVKRALRQLALRLEGDVKSAEPAHILRVPQTMNHKYSPPRPVKVEYIDVDKKYDIAEILKVTAPSNGIPKSAAYIKGRAYMADLPPAVQGEHGDDATYRAACVLVRDMGLDTDDALELMMEWNTRCEPPWSSSDLMKKIKSAEAYGINDRGISDPAVDFEDFGGVDNVNIGPDEESNLVKLSKKYKVVNDNGTMHIYEKIRNEELNRQEWRWSSKKDFLEICQSVEQLPLKQIGEKKNHTPIYMPTAKYWLDVWQGKKTFNGMTMRPECPEERTPDGMLNMWKGFAYVPRPGSWVLFKNFIFETICRWDTESYEYILNWMARAVQYPSKPAETAIVLKGKKRAGKGTFGKAFYKLFGEHGITSSNSKHLVGNFNGHLRSCVVLFADEAFYAGDKDGESKLKGLITEPALMYESKGKNPVMGRNCLHIIMASNLDWVVPAGMDNERRFAVFELEDNNRNTQEWNKLYDELNNGGREAMLYDLMNRDISNFDPMRVPQTEALAAQKEHGMDSGCRWL